MSSILDTFRTLLPPRAKASPSGWISFNAPCCHHRGHNQDKRKRGITSILWWRRKKAAEQFGACFQL